MKSTFLVYVPFTGLGLYRGFRGNRWLRNRIKVFKQFVLENLEHQTDQDFVLWISWRQEEKNNKYVKQLENYLKGRFNYVFTYSGVCFWDDKYSDEVAKQRLMMSVHTSTAELLDYLKEDYVDMLIQPSDDLYDLKTIENIKTQLNSYQAVGHQRGYIVDYTTKNVLEYNPKTNPPFFAIRFKKEDFIDAPKHLKYTGPYKSHEYVGDYLKMKHFEHRGFMVGTHRENISTHFNHPYGGRPITGIEKEGILKQFGIDNVKPVKIKFSLRKYIMSKLPYRFQRKLRYWVGERLFNWYYNFIRN